MTATEPTPTLAEQIAKIEDEVRSRQEILASLPEDVRSPKAAVHIGRLEAAGRSLRRYERAVALLREWSRGSRMVASVEFWEALHADRDALLKEIDGE